MNRITRHIKSQQGQTIIEAIIALMTILIILTAIAIVIVNGLYNSRFIKNQNEANKYAQQGIEFVRNFQRNDLATFGELVLDDLGEVPEFSTYCIDQENSMLTNEDCNDDTANTAGIYNRTVSFTPPGTKCHDTEIVTISTVKWSTSKCPDTNRFCHMSQLESCLPFEYPASEP